MHVVEIFYLCARVKTRGRILFVAGGKEQNYYD